MNKETAIKLTGEQINILLRKKPLNVDLLDIHQPSQPHTIIVTGNLTEGGKPKFIGTSKSSVVKDGLPSKIIVTAMTKSNDLNQTDSDYHGIGKGQNYTIFQGSRPDLFNFISEQIVAKNYKSIGDPTAKKPKIELNQRLYGNTLTFIVPKYTPHVWNTETGVMEPLKSTTVDPWTRERTETDMVLVEYNRFYDEDELKGHVTKIIESEMESRVVPFFVMTKTFKEEIAGITTKVVNAEAAISNENVEYEEDGSIKAKPENVKKVI